MSERSVVVARCGFLGLAAARQFQDRGWMVLGITHSAETAARLSAEDFRVVACDIARPAALEALAKERGPFEVVVHCASSGRGEAEDYRRVYFEGARGLMEKLQPEFMMFTSSTSVYAQLDGSWVTEQSP